MLGLGEDWYGNERRGSPAGAGGQGGRRYPDDGSGSEKVVERRGRRGYRAQQSAPAAPRGSCAEGGQRGTRRTKRRCRTERGDHGCSCPRGGCVRRGGERSRGLGHAFQDDDRDDPLGLLRVVAERREGVAMRLVQTVALESFRDRCRASLELLGPDLDLGFAMLDQVVVPGGMSRGAAHRSGYDVAIAVSVIHERGGPNLPGLRPACREQEEFVTEHPDPLAALRTELVDDPFVPISHAG